MKRVKKLISYVLWQVAILPEYVYLKSRDKARTKADISKVANSALDAHFKLRRLALGWNGYKPWRNVIQLELRNPDKFNKGE